MANLSNINNYFIVDTSGKGVFGDVASFSSTQHGPLNVFKSGAAAAICIDSSGGSGRMYQLRSETSGSFVIYDNPSCAHRMEISSGGDVTFSGSVTTGTGLKLYTDGSGNGVIYNLGQDKDLYLVGDDGGVGVNALVFDMSAGGNATFANEITSGDDINAGGKVVCANVGTDKKIAFRRTGANNWSIEHDASQIYFYNETGTKDVLLMKNAGQIMLGEYGSGTFTGTVAKNLAVDSSGNIIETDGGVVDGSGTANDVAMWSDSNTLTDAPIAISGNNATFAGSVLPTTDAAQDIGGSNKRWNFGYFNNTISVTDGNISAGTDFDFNQGATFAGNVDIYTGDSSATLNIGRNSSERLTIYQDDNHTTLTADNDSDGNGTHNFILNRTFDGSGANNFIVQKGGTAQLTIDTNGNVGIGTTSPTTLLNTLVTANSENMTLGSAANMGFKVGNTTGNEYGICMGVGDSGRGWIQVGRTDGTAIAYDLTLQSSGGNVGIGTTSPNMKLNISHADQDGLRFNCADGLETFIDFGDASDNDIGRISYDHADNHMAFRTNNAERMRITSAGYLGLATTSPSQLFHCNGNALITKLGVKAFNAGFDLYNDGTSYFNGATTIDADVTINGLIELDEASGAHGFINTDGTNYEFDINRNPVTGAISDSAKGCARIAMRAEDGGAGSRIIFATAAANNTTATERMRIDKSGNVGIGLTSPGYLIHGNNGANSRADIQLTYNALGTGNSDGVQFGIQAGGAYVWNFENSDVYFATNNSRRMTINSSGAVGIGTTTPQFSLEVDGAASALNAHFGQGQNNGSGVFGGISLGYAEANTSYRKVGLVAKALADGAARQDFCILVDTVSDSGSAGLADTKFKIDGLTGDTTITGTVTATADVVAYSDKKLKKNIKTLDGSKVYDMRGVSFTRKDNGNESSGVIAQEIQKIAPELVNETDGTLGVAYGNLTGYLIEAIKDLKKEIEECKKQKCNCNK